MILGASFPDLTTLHKKVTLSLALGKYVDSKRGSSVVSTVNLLYADRASFEDFDFAFTACTRHRFNRFVREYVDKEAFKTFCQEASDGKETIFYTKRIQRKMVMNTSLPNGANSHRYGQCLLALDYRPNPSTITMFSRTSAFTRGGTLDLALVSIAARCLPPTKVVFFCTSIQCVDWQVIALATGWGCIDKLAQMDNSMGRSIARRLEKGLTYNYVTQKRALERAFALGRGEIEPILVSSLEV